MGKKIEISGVGVRVDFYYGSVLESPRGFLRVEYSSAVLLSRDPRLIGVGWRIAWVPANVGDNSLRWGSSRV